MRFGASLFAVLGAGACSDASVPFEEIGVTQEPITQTLNFQDGAYVFDPPLPYSGTRDSRISAASPSTNYGNSALCGAAGGPNEISCVLLWFNLGSYVPASAAIVSATIFLNVIDATSSTYNVYELKQHWKESAVTWNDVVNSTPAGPHPWQVPGAKGANDRGALVGTLTGAVGIRSIQLNSTGLALIQSWILNGNSDVNGFIIANESATDLILFYASEATTIANRPRLQVTFNSVN